MTAREWDDLHAAIARAVAVMPAGHVRVLAERISPHTGPETAGAITREPPVREYTQAATAILDAWSRLPDDITGPTIATALLAASATKIEVEHRQQVSLVWTGPDTSHIRARPTSDVIVEVIDAAQRTLLLVSFASSKVQRVLDALHRAAARGVTINLLLENEDAAEGQYAAAQPEPFQGVPATVYEWANPERPRVAGKPAVMHAKIVLADDHTAFITSANLTSRALDKNMEAGTLVRGGPIPKSIEGHFRQLAYDEVVRPVT